MARDFGPLPRWSQIAFPLATKTGRQEGCERCPLDSLAALSTATPSGNDTQACRHTHPQFLGAGGKRCDARHTLQKCNPRGRRASGGAASPGRGASSMLSLQYPAVPTPRRGAEVPPPLGVQAGCGPRRNACGPARSPINHSVGPGGGRRRGVRAGATIRVRRRAPAHGPPAPRHLCVGLRAHMHTRV